MAVVVCVCVGGGGGGGGGGGKRRGAMAATDHAAVGKRAREALDSLLYTGASEGAGGGGADDARGEGNHVVEGGGVVAGTAGLAPAAFSPAGEPLGAPPASCRPWDRSDLLLRLATFRARTWFAKPAVCSAGACARRGWHNVSQNVLECATCKAQLAYVVPAGLPRAEALKRAERFAKQLGSAHADGCGWRTEECPETLAAFPRLDSSALAREFAARVGALDSAIESAPLVDETAMARAVGGDESAAKALEALLADERPDQPPPAIGEGGVVRPAAYRRALRALALAGWQATPLPYAVLSPTASAPAGRRKGADVAFAPVDDAAHERPAVALRCTMCGAVAALWAFGAGASRPRTGRFGRPLTGNDSAFSPPVASSLWDLVPKRPAPPKRTPAPAPMSMPSRTPAAAATPAPAATASGAQAALPTPVPAAALSMTIAGGVLPGTGAAPPTGPFGAASAAPAFGLGIRTPTQPTPPRERPQGQSGEGERRERDEGQGVDPVASTPAPKSASAHAVLLTTPTNVPPPVAGASGGEADGPSFNPLRAHRLHCPWVACPKGEPAGWRRTLDALVVGVDAAAAPGHGSAGREGAASKRARTSGGADHVQLVKKLLDASTKGT